MGGAGFSSRDQEDIDNLSFYRAMDDPEPGLGGNTAVVISIREFFDVPVCRTCRAKIQISEHV
ncbi:hypothetical protein GCM10011362_31540 [Marinobacter halophilus]|uniref:Uncharacterized protein n=1 Tax=Marinobacter halophilus TaxID=1323740 RepID=A0A2T1KBG9_9GAMM|nr:hypothetical protein C7H08_13560 [Marinobacter halophilus]GGC80639.1 hypothetical protein GCM10011362_31540 [Marinobacter halophilus]